ncbi:hypothetical protein OB919_15120 [Halobacteria archaeon AArc-curdl1]|uniref:Uncharacterized protein n=1 Tax=Natronosalvus hydrolyticus TaxID=2979988 RepID=A0AAP2Z9X2_9EURY|nr:hypothetical protein [Halobacteria archaeon AArc-curdl1]
MIIPLASAAGPLKIPGIAGNRRVLGADVRSKEASLEEGVSPRETIRGGQQRISRHSTLDGDTARGTARSMAIPLEAQHARWRYRSRHSTLE